MFYRAVSVISVLYFGLQVFNLLLLSLMSALLHLQNCYHTNGIQQLLICSREPKRMLIIRSFIIRSQVQITKSGIIFVSCHEFNHDCFSFLWIHLLWVYCGGSAGQELRKGFTQPWPVQSFHQLQPLLGIVHTSASINYWQKLNSKMGTAERWVTVQVIT